MAPTLKQCTTQREITENVPQNLVASSLIPSKMGHLPRKISSNYES